MSYFLLLPFRIFTPFTKFLFLMRRNRTGSVFLLVLALSLSFGPAGLFLALFQSQHCVIILFGGADRFQFLPERWWVDARPSDGNRSVPEPQKYELEFFLGHGTFERVEKIFDALRVTPGNRNSRGAKLIESRQVALVARLEQIVGFVVEEVVRRYAGVFGVHFWYSTAPGC